MCVKHGAKVDTNCARLKDAKVKPNKEECVLSMVQRLNTNDAAMKDAQALHRREEFVPNMGQRENYAAVRMHKSS